MDARKNSPTTQPKGGKRQVSQRGMLSLVMLLVSVGVLSIAMIGGAKLAYDVLLSSSEGHQGWQAAVVALGITYALGWLAAMVAIRVYGNLVLPILINMLMWICLAGICYLYIEILQRLYKQEYQLANFVKYVAVMIAGLAALVGLHLVIEDHNLRPFSFPLLFLSVIQLGMIVFRYVFREGKPVYILGDLFFLFGMSAFSIMMLAHVGLLDPLRKRFTNYFDMNSVSIRTDN